MSEHDIKDRAEAMDSVFNEVPEYREAPATLAVRGGALVRCPGQTYWRRLMPAYNRKSGGVVHGTFMVEIDGKLKVAARNYALEKGFQLVEAGKDEEFERPKREGYPKERGTRGS